MPGYTVTKLEDVDDVLGDYPGEMRMLTGGLGCEQVAFTYRRMPQATGGKGSYGHRHAEQEEVYFVISGKLEFKLGDEVDRGRPRHRDPRRPRGLPVGLERRARGRRDRDRLHPQRGLARGVRSRLLARRLNEPGAPT